jgi:DNA-binding IscR family transcriptional regulator
MGSVIRLLEGPLAPLPCASETAYRKCDECVDDRICGTRMVMRQVRDAMAEILDGTTLAQVCERMEEAKARVAKDADEALMYYI